MRNITSSTTGTSANDVLTRARKLIGSNTLSTMRHETLLELLRSQDVAFKLSRSPDVGRSKHWITEMRHIESKIADFIGDGECGGV